MKPIPSLAALALMMGHKALLQANAFAPCNSMKVFNRIGKCDQRQNHMPIRRVISFVSKEVNMSPSASPDAEGNMDDETLLNTVTKPYLVDLCKQMDLSTKGSKTDLLYRIRSFVDAEAAKQRKRRQRLNEEIEAGIDKDGYPTKHRLVNDGVLTDGGFDEVQMLDEGAFYFEYSGSMKGKEAEENNGGANSDGDRDDDASNSSVPITVPPPPPIEPNADGERVVTVYSTKDENDMTGTNTESLMGEPGQEGMMGGYSRMGGSSNPEDTLAGGPFGDTSGTQRRRADEKELDDAAEGIVELVQGLLAMTGAPGFQDEFQGGLQPVGDKDFLHIDRSVESSSQPQQAFIGFDPSNIPTDMLTSASKALRAGGGQALRETLSQFEIQAIGHDGMGADDISKGGGHYREVRKVGAFLEGYRRAEIRRIARETATMLLDKLVTEGVKGLDLMLATMGKAGDDGAGDAGELNDSLIEYFNDAIRQQEKKVEQLLGNQEKSEKRMGPKPTTGSIRREKLEDQTSGLWNVTMVGGDVVESIDPNEPSVQEAIKAELERSAQAPPVAPALPTSASEQLLLLLTCLRDRVKAEAAFSTDEKGRNLRILAYVIHAINDQEREQIVVKELGSSLDRLESFLELLRSAIEFSESTSNELQPSTSGKGPSAPMLKHIKKMVEDVLERHMFESSGIAKKGDAKP